MMHVNELFYNQSPAPPFMSESSAQQLIRDPKLYTENQAPAPPPPKKPEEPKNKPIVLSVSICCASCVDSIDPDIRKVKDVKNVECDVMQKKVTVTGGNLADVLSAARRHFKDAKLWE